MFDDLKPHIADLRKRLTLSVIVIIVFAFFAFYFHKIIIDFTKAPLVSMVGKDPFIGGIG
ncbi:MAG: hypothetical protein IE878_00675, partial [Epsilonproteobacteria bacterium]|nr:hypothetical protein [Campylobacterota bacterium]